jgi:hypothetical protein
MSLRIVWSWSIAVLSLGVLAAAARAGGEPASRSEADSYARAERDSSGLDAFEGGGSAASEIVLPLDRGTGDAATRLEVRGYAEREAASPGLEDFEGGELGGLIIALAVIAAIVLIVWIIVPWK